MNSKLQILLVLLFSHIISETAEIELDCRTLRIGQFLCPDPSVDIVDAKTQQFKDCTKEGKAKGIIKLFFIIMYLFIIQI